MSFDKIIFCTALREGRYTFQSMCEELYEGFYQARIEETSFSIDVETQILIRENLPQLLEAFYEKKKSLEVIEAQNLSLQYWVSTLTTFEANNIRSQLLHQTATILDKIEEKLLPRTIALTATTLSQYQDQDETNAIENILRALHAHTNKLNETQQYFSQCDMAVTLYNIWHLPTHQTKALLSTFIPHFKSYTNAFTKEQIELILEGVCLINQINDPIRDILQELLRHLEVTDVHTLNSEIVSDTIKKIQQLMQDYPDIPFLYQFCTLLMGEKKNENREEILHIFSGTDFPVYLTNQAPRKMINDPLSYEKKDQEETIETRSRLTKSTSQESLTPPPTKRPAKLKLHTKAETKI